MIKLLKQTIYEIIDECVEEMKDLQHIENVARLYKEEDL